VSHSHGSEGCCSPFQHDGPRDERDSSFNKLGIISSVTHTSDTDHTVDIEKGISEREHVILSVSGMTCSGCEAKLTQTLGKLRAVRNLKTSMIMARAEFDLEVGVLSLDGVIADIHRKTGFKCEAITSQGSGIDLTVRGDVAEFAKGPRPDGVTDITVVDKTTVNVAYDPSYIGVRSLMDAWNNDGQGPGSNRVSVVELAPRRADPAVVAGRRGVKETGLFTTISAILTIPVLVISWAPIPGKRGLGFSIACLVLATLVQFGIAGQFYPPAIKSLIFSGAVEMDLLIVLSTTAAYGFSVVCFGYYAANQPILDTEFFETSTLLVTLIMVGRFAAAVARHNAMKLISIRSLQIPTATLVRSDESTEEVDVRLLQYGDIFKVAPYERVPTDGTVVDGSSEIDESMITGESLPVAKSVQSGVIAGTINGPGTLLVRLRRLPGDNTIDSIACMVDEAKLSKPKIQDIADRVAGYFVPVVVSLAVITMIAWLVVGMRTERKSRSQAAIQAITFAITVLIVSCPCAFGLASPMVIVIASGMAAEHGIVFKSSEAIEVAHKTSHVVFDKTGTLTQGQLSVKVASYTDSNQKDEYLPVLLGLLEGIKHPVAAAVHGYLRDEGVVASYISDQTVHTGKGVEGTSEGRVIRAGNSRWLQLSAHELVEPVLASGYSAFCFTVNDELIAAYGLEDSLRGDALSTVQELQKRGISVHVISGDDDGAVRSTTTRLGIPPENVRSRCAPGDKKVYVEQLLSIPVPSKSWFRSKGSEHKSVVIFCGDGTNDAVALAQATIGVHMNDRAGADVAQSAADVVLMRPNLGGILSIIVLSKKAIRRIQFNFAWSFVYNVLALLMAAGALSAYNVKIPAEYAGLGELVSVLPVIANAVLLKWSKIDF